MTYSKKTLSEINEKHRGINHAHDDLLLRLGSFQQKLKNEKAREYLMQGVGRRLKTITRCIDNIFTLFPANQIKHLSKEDLTDLDINLHAFFINIAGVFDNLGWVFVYENELLGKVKEGKIPRIGVGLFNESTQKYLKTELREYLNSDPTKSWYENYSKNYRDSLAHRIPLYVPPSLLSKAEAKEYQNIDEQIRVLDFTGARDRDRYDELRNTQYALGRACHLFAHSLKEGGRPVYLHAQVFADYATVEEVIDRFCKSFS